MEWPELGGVHATGLALGILSAAIFLLVVGFWPRRSRAPETSAAKTESEELHALWLCLQGELEQFVRDMSGRLDAKMHALRRLLQEARNTIDELQQLSGTPTNRSNIAAPPTTHDEDMDAEEALLDRSGLAVRAAAHETKRPDRASLESRNQRRLRVCSLADEGLNPTAIASEIGMQRGEVELILSLQRKPHHLDGDGRTEPTRVAHSSEEALV